MEHLRMAIVVDTKTWTPTFDPNGRYRAAATPEAQQYNPLEGNPANKYVTPLTEGERAAFSWWVKRNGISDEALASGQYDYTGAFKAGADPATDQAWATPAHETFSVNSRYAQYAPERAGRWDGETFVPSDAVRMEQETAATNAANAETAASLQQLESESPGRYKLISQSEFDGWRADWEQANRSKGLLDDTGHLLNVGMSNLDKTLQEVVGAIPGIGPHLQGMSNAFDRWAYGSEGVVERANEDIESSIARLTPEMTDARQKPWWNEETNSFGSAWLDPNAYVAGVVESLPATVLTMAPGMMLARGSYLAAVAAGASTKAAAAAAAKTALISGALLEGGMGAGDSSLAVRESIARMPPEELANTEAVQALVKQGMSVDEAIAAITEDATSQAFVLGGVATSLFAGFGDAFLAKLIAEGVGGGIAKRIISGATKGIVGEGLLEEMPQEALSTMGQNLALQNTVDPNRDLTEGALNAALGGAAVGGTMGATLGGLGGAARPASPEMTAIPPDGVPAPAPPAGPLASAVGHGLRTGGPMPPAPAYDEDTGEPLNPGPAFDAQTGEPLMRTGSDTVVVPDAVPVPTSPINPLNPPAPGSSVIVEAPGLERFTGKVEQYVDEGGAVEALVYDAATGESFQVPLEALQTANLSDADVAAMDLEADPPIEREATPTPAGKSRMIGSQNVQFPDEQHARLYDFGEQLRMSKGLARVGGESALEAREIDPETRAALADELQIPRERVNEIADDYRHRTQKAAKAGPKNGLPLDMHGVPDKLLLRMQKERLKTERDAARATATLPSDGATAQADVTLSVTDTIDAAAHEAATSPTNDLPEPTQAQKEAGNYALGHFKTGGLDLSIENPAGSERKGVDKGGKAWSVTMKSHYGYIRGTVGRDKDHVDVFVQKETGELGDDAPVFVIDQVVDGKFDEHKVMLGFKTLGQAKKAYLANYAKGWNGLGAISPTTMGDFKEWLRAGDTRKEFAKAKEAYLDEPEPTALQHAINEEGAARKELPAGLLHTASQAYGKVLKRLTASSEAWHASEDQYADLVENPERYHRVIEEANDKGIKVGDEVVRANREPGFATSISTQGTTQGVLYAAHDGYPVWYPVTEVEKVSSGKKPKAGPDAVAAAVREARKPAETLAPKAPAAKPPKAKAPSKELTPPNPPEIPDSSPPADPFAKNKLFTADKVAAAKARLRGKMGQLNSGIDPEVLIDGMTIAGAYIEAGVRNFADYAKQMTGDFGDGIKPYLLSFWEGARNYPGLDTAGMTSVEESAKAHAALVTTLPASEAAALGAEVAKPKTRAKRSGRPEDRALEQDWGVEHIDGYSNDPSREEGNDVKDAFLKDATAYLRQVAKLLEEAGFTVSMSRSGKPMKAVSANPSGVSGSGDVTMTMHHPDTGANVYAHIGATALRGVVPTNASGISVMYRTSRQPGDTYGALGTNRWAPTTLTAGEFAAILEGEAKGSAPAFTRPEVANGKAQPRLDLDDQGRVGDAPDAGDAAQSRPARADRRDVEAVEPDLLAQAPAGRDRSEAGIRPPGTDVAGAGQPDRERDAGDGRARAGGEGTSDAGTGSGTGSSIEPSPANPGPGNFHIADALKIVGGGQVARFDKNIAAIDLFNQIRDEGRPATREEQEVIAGYTGWGSFGQDLFQGTWGTPRPKAGWEKRSEQLRDHLGQAEWESLQRSITNAHYTDPPTVMAMWDMVKRMGFTGGRTLEPSMGIGNFFGMMPEDVAARSQLTGVELEQVTGGMAKLLYPDANISIMGYQESKTPDGFYDLVIGNWPFENTVIADRRYNRLSPFLHDYFFLKTLDQARAGGLVVGITTKGTLDKKESAIRTALAKKGELVAAFRLPSGAFEEYAGTAVVTDIVILRKRAEPVQLVSDAGWIKSVPYKTPAGPEVWLNEYYVANPSHVIGTIDFGDNTTIRRPGMVVHRPADMKGELERIVGLVPEGAYQPPQQAKHVAFITNHTDDREGALTQSKGDFFIVRGEHLAPAQDIVSYRVKDQAETRRRERQFERLIDMRKRYAQLIEAERSGKGDAEKARKALRDAYETFETENGALSKSFGLDYMRRIDDPFYPALAALETMKDGKAVPAAILRESTMRKAVKVTKPSIADAFVLARATSVSPQLGEIAKLAEKPEAEVRAALVKNGAVFALPNGDIAPSDIYLSGNVREKLRAAQAGLDAGDTAMERNVKALKEVIPADIPYFNIEVQLGASWVPLSVYEQYIAHTLNLTSTDGIRVTYAAGRWRIDISDKLLQAPEARAGYGTAHYPYRRLVNAAISNQNITIRRTDSDGKEYVDKDATEETNARIGKLREDFGDWLWSDPERRVDVEVEYNEVRNAYAVPRFDGSFLTFEGMALSLGRGAFDLRQHQVNAIWRALVTRKSLNAHEVGTGKTFTMGGIAVESRRYGIARKPLLFAHNANSKSVASEIQQMYPSAKVLYLDNLAPDLIDVKMRQIANDDWDAIVVPHSLISRFALKEETLMAMAAEEIAALESEAYAAAKEDGVALTDAMLDDPEQLKKLRSPTAKDLVKMRNRIIETIKKQAQRSSKEGAISFEELGVDQILVDEAHEFKKPPFATRMRIKGLQTATSDQSIALNFLTTYIRGQNGGANVHLFTGTPITNTLTEVFHQMRYIMREDMAEAALDQWDGWFGSFAREVQDVELNAAAESESVTRLAAFINVPELRRMIGQFMDVVFSNDMPEMRPRRTATGKTLDATDLSEKERAELLNGRTENAADRPYKKVIVDNADMTPAQLVAFKQIQGYAREWRKMTGKARKDAMLNGAPESPIIHEGLAAKASFDVRLLDGEGYAGKEGRVADDARSKASRVIKNVVDIYRSHPMATQVVFTEQGISTEASRSVGAPGEKTTRRYKTFSTVQDIIARLVEDGIPRDQIALVDGSTSKDKRKEIADAMNLAKIRVVIGSTKALGVGVNMQRNLRAMHHMDAPWMPGDLEQRNGRGHRQGNQWNTVLEYRYLTDRLDGRRWQVLAIKQRFINAFLKADDKTRVIEGDAASDDESDILSTFSEAAGDPRLMIREKLKKKVEQLQKRERLHGVGVADAKRSAARSRKDIASNEEWVATLQAVAEPVAAAVTANAGKAFRMTIEGTEYESRGEADEAIDAMIGERFTVGSKREKIGTYGGLDVFMHWPAHSRVPMLSIADGKAVESKAPSIASLESAMRSVAKDIAGFQGEVASSRRSIERMEQVALEPFARAADLERAQKDLDALEDDIAANPVPPPAWLRAGAPIETEVHWKGRVLEVTGHRWTPENWFVLGADGAGAEQIPYNEVRDDQGMPLYEERPFEAPEVIQKAAPAAEGAKSPAVESSEVSPPDDAEYSAADMEPVATLTGTELGADDVGSLRKAALRWYSDNLVGEAVKTAAGQTVLFNQAGAKETSTSAGNATLLKAIPALRDIIAKGKVLRTYGGGSTPPTAFETLGARIIAVREARAMNQAALANELNISPQRLGQYERNQRTMPHDVLQRLWKATGADANFLLFGMTGGLPVDLLRGTDQDVKERLVIGAAVSIGGKVHNLAVTINRTDDGRFHYDIMPAPTKAEGDFDDAGVAPDGWNMVETGEAQAGLSEAQKAELDEIVRTVSGLDKAVYLDRLTMPAGNAGWGNDAPRSAAGMYQPSTDLVVLAEDSATDRTAYHEAFHRLQNLFLTDAERKLLKAEAAKLRRIINAFEFRRGQAAKMSQKELEAEAFAIWATGKSTVQPLKGIAAAWARIKTAIERVSNWLRGNGLAVAEDVFARGRSGEIARREERKPGAPVDPRPQSEREAAFRKWFGESVVVDHNGAPLRMFHGAKLDFDRFDTARSELGTHFGTTSQANSISEGSGPDPVRPGARTYPVFVSLKKPLRLEDRGNFENAEVAEQLSDLGIITKDRAKTLSSRGRANLRALQREIEGAGYDGVVYLNRREAVATARADFEGYENSATDEGFAERYPEARDSYIVFHPHQVKSAIANRGDYDARDPRIEYSMADAAPAKAARKVAEEATGKWTDVQPKLMATVPLTYFSELARPGMSAVAEYLRTKRQMDAYRGTKHADADAISQDWLKFIRTGFGLLPSAEGKAKAAALADLMHDSTLAGVDPASSDPDVMKNPAFPALRKRLMAMPQKGRELYMTVRDAYKAQADELDALIIENVRKSQQIAIKKAEEAYEQDLARIRSSSLKGLELQDALDRLNERHGKDLLRSSYANKARLSKLRATFENSRVPAPYFPLARFGRYFVSVKDVDGTVVSFSRREKAADRNRLAADLRAAYPGMSVETGVIDQAGAGLRETMDPRIVAEIEAILSGGGVDPSVMDAVWQRYLQSMPDLSTRKRFIHRKGTQGFDSDALRAFSSHMFHAAHQMTRLKHGVDLTEMLDQVALQARKADDPDKGMTLANELAQRHKWIMNPTGSSAAQFVTSAMFVWYLAASPAAALVNLTQTPMLGIPIVGARFGIAKTSAALLKASRDFIAGKGSAANGALTVDERWAMEQFLESGLIDRTQSHDLAGVGDTGVKYSPLRARVMGIISWGFHKAEVMNREVTALAAYRLARAAGEDPKHAVNTAHDLTWRVHFDYSNSSRPRMMQTDATKILLVFQNYQVNMWYRIFRDIHQSFKGETPQARKEARYQLAGIIGMMTLLGGVTGMFGYNVLMAIAAIFFDDEDDPFTFAEEMERHVIELFGPDVGGMILKGVPGKLLNIDLTSRLGMPDIFVRTPDDPNLDGRDWMTQFIVGAMGVVPQTAINWWDGFSLIKDGNMVRGLELMAPKAVKDLMQAYRFANEGLTTRRGDELMPAGEFDAYATITKMIGFTPAKVSETYDRNAALMNAEQRILDMRSALLNQFATALAMGDETGREAVLTRIRAFNAVPAHRAVAITPDTIKRSLAARQRNAAKREDGVLIQNEGLGRALRALQPERVAD